MRFLNNWFHKGGLREMTGWVLSAVLAVYAPTAWLVVTTAIAAAVIGLALLVQFMIETEK